MKFKIKKGDRVKVLSGKDRGKTGEVLQTLRDKERVIVEGVNIVKKATRANPKRSDPGGLVEKPSPIHISNVMAICPRTQKASRVKFVKDKQGVRRRTILKSGEQLK